MAKIILLPDGVEHGTRYAYNHYKCRCLDCTWTNKVYCAERKERRKELGPPAHGNENAYNNYGCRCEPCRIAHSMYLKNYRAGRRGT